MGRIDWKAVLASVNLLAMVAGVTPAAARTAGEVAIAPPVPVPAKRQPQKPQPQPQQRSPAGVTARQAETSRLARITAARSWGYQLHGLSLDKAAVSPYDMLVVDATGGVGDGKPFTRADVERLKRKPDGSRRIVISYLSVGESEDYRPDYFTPEYMTEDAPDWLLQENKDWKGNRLIRFCNQGWQMTILGDEDGRNVYNSIDPSPLYKLLELGFDGIYLDRVDVYGEVAKECPDGARKMVDFIARLGAHARKRDPQFLVVLQNAEELLEHEAMMATVDAIAKESLFHGWAGDNTDNAETLRLLKRAKAAGRAVFVVDYPLSTRKAEASVARIKALGYVPYVAPKELDQLWTPGTGRWPAAPAAP